MSVSISVKEKYNNIILGVEDIKKLALISFKPWEEEYKIAEKKWEEEQLPILDERIKKHNEDVKNDKSTYSFNTFQSISPEDQQTIIQKEKDFFIYTSEKVYKWRSSFDVETNTKTYKGDSPDVLDLINPNEVKNITIDVTSDSGKKIKIIISLEKTYSQDVGITISLEGESTWVTHTKADLQEVIEYAQKPEHITKYKSLLNTILTILVSYTLFSVLYKTGVVTFLWETKLMFNALILLLVLLFVTTVYSKINKLLNDLFPNFALLPNYKPFNKTLVIFASTLLIGLLTNLLYDILKLLFKS